MLYKASTWHLQINDIILHPKMRVKVQITSIDRLSHPANMPLGWFVKGDFLLPKFGGDSRIRYFAEMNNGRFSHVFYEDQYVFLLLDLPSLEDDDSLDSWIELEGVNS